MSAAKPLNCIRCCSGKIRHLQCYCNVSYIFFLLQQRMQLSGFATDILNSLMLTLNRYHKKKSDLILQYLAVPKKTSYTFKVDKLQLEQLIKLHLGPWFQMWQLLVIRTLFTISAVKVIPL